jgi:hypothetical protein
MSTAPTPITAYRGGIAATAGKRLKYLFNGAIHTMNAEAPAAAHMLVAGDRIWACDDEIAPLGLDFREPGFGDTVRRLSTDIDFVDLEGSTVIPGMVDSHVHFMWWALNAARADLTSARSESECVEILRTHTAGRPRTDWAVGFGWSHNAWENSNLPTRESLDSAFPDTPVFMSSKCGHLAWVNSAALAIAGIDASSPDPAGGEIERSEHAARRALTGILKETAINIVESVIPHPSKEVSRHALAEGQQRAHSLGLTGVQTPEDLATWEFLQTEHAAGHLTMRISFWMPANAIDHLYGMRARAGLGDNTLGIGAVKLFTDGSLGGRTAWMRDPFDGEPGNLGICVTEPDEIRRITLKSNLAGLPVAVHAIGDRAVGEVLNAFESVAKELAAGTARPLRNRIEHLQLVAPQDMDRLRRVRPVASVQPVHLCADMGPADRLWGRRSRYAYAFRTLADAGCMLAFGSDAPVEPINPFLGVFAAVTRQNLELQPGNGWYPEEKIGAREAIAAYTVNPAIAAGNQRDLGDLSPGKLADFVVLPEDPLAIPAANLPNLVPTATFVGGECVHPHEPRR